MQHLKSLAWLGLVYGIGKTENLGTEFVGDELIGIEFFGNESAKMNNLGTKFGTNQTSTNVYD